MYNVHYTPSDGLYIHVHVHVESLNDFGESCRLMFQESSYYGVITTLWAQKECHHENDSALN